MIEFIVYGEPVAQGRPRAGKTKSGDVVMYDPGKSKNYKKYVSAVASQYKPRELIESPVSLTVKVYRPIPKSFSKADKYKALQGVLRPKSKPDLSNYIKGVEDALEGILVRNDSQVVDYGESGKWYSDDPRIEIVLEVVV
ncbi:RusA family crossover junction endodeoxyribonuclease [Paenibacillus qinlingensis]|uniref:Holliday junction resolvase RusA-like endonuclease n=1 Tax=Paenibacillus qinlingensis TaxID=1837343 RepID=A0ABU1P6S1_9BACL|nr:RusA family crossover junction endodeoxyribonuclease [Paenibacillus qinlingensis]MDR6555459.1 Holliday junction resolvase RusA-like endonuclease [Paenibacillus qinlingensis]